MILLCKYIWKYHFATHYVSVIYLQIMILWDFFQEKTFMCEDKGMGESASFVSGSHPEEGCRVYWAWLDHHPQVWEWYSGQSFAFHFSPLAEGGGSDWCHQWCASRTSSITLSDEKGWEEGTENTSYKMMILFCLPRTMVFCVLMFVAGLQKQLLFACAHWWERV